MYRMLWFVLISVLFCFSVAASPLPDGEIATVDADDQIDSSAFDEILLKDGTLLRGKIIEEREDLVVFETTSLGRLEIARDQIERLAPHGKTAGVLNDPDQNSIMFCPTPATLPKGDAYFRDFELFLLNFGFGVTDNFDLSFGTLFPISSDLLLISVGGKLRLLDRDKFPVGLALTGGFTLLEETSFGMVGGVIGIGNVHNSLNLAVNATFEEDGQNGVAFLIGGDVQISRRTKLFAEFFNSDAILISDEDDLKGFINIGFRIFGNNHSFSLSGFRPLMDDTESFIAFPMLMYSHHW